MTTVSFLSTYVIVAIILIFHPWFSRKNVLFGVVFGSIDIWNSKEAIAVRKRYITESIIIAVVIGMAAVIFNSYVAHNLATVSLAAMLLLIVAQIFPFIEANRTIKKYKAGLKNGNENLVDNKISIEIGQDESKAVLPAAWTLLLLIPIVPTIILALTGYNAMPSALPTHYSFTDADAWSPKSWTTALLPIFLQVTLGGIILICALLSRRAPASVRGNPDAAPDYQKFRKYIVILLLVIGIVMQISFMMMEISYITPISVLLINIPTIASLLLVVVLFYIYFKFVRVGKPTGAVLNDDSKWILGMFYYNPSDPAIFVEKRSGIGFTTNFANPVAWIFTIGLIIVIVLLSLFVHQK
jgi:uncharacterized membrane protein